MHAGWTVKLSPSQTLVTLDISVDGGIRFVRVVPYIRQRVALATPEHSCDDAEVKASLAIKNHAVPAELLVRPVVVPMLRRKQSQATMSNVEQYESQWKWAVCTNGPRRKM